MTGQVRVLVVEDENIVSLEIQTRLKGLGYEVAGAVASAEEAIETIAQRCPDLVLMDIRLKGRMDGIEAAEHIRERFGIPVVYLTAYADESTLQRAKVTEPFGYIIKPFEERELYKTIEMALSKHRMEIHLKERERWLNTTLRSIGDAVITIDTLGRVTFMNPVAEELTGWNHTDALEKALDEIFHIIDERTQVEVENPVSRVLQEGSVVGLANHTVLISRNGKEIPIDDSAAPIKDDKGNIIGVVLIFRDISERRRATDELGKQKALLDEIINGIQEGIGIVDKDEVITFCNPAYAAILGDEAKQIVGKSLFEIFPTEAHEIIREQSARRQRGESSTYDLPLVTPQGKRKFVRITVSPRYSKDGTYYGAFGAMMDISDRKAAEDTLERKTGQQNQLLQTARYLTESLDVKEVLTRIATGAKENIEVKGCSLYLLEEDGKTLTPVVSIDPDYEQEILSTPLNVASSLTGKAVLAKKALVFNDPQSDHSGTQIPGTPVEMEEKIIVAPLIVDERVLGAMCMDRMGIPFTPEDLALAETFATYASTALKNAQTYNDLQKEVLQRRRMERMLKQTMAELKRSNDELQQFAYVASHDLQEPLRMVASYVQLLSKRYHGRLDKDADDFIHFAVDGATRMQGLINDLLAYSRVGTRGRPFESTDLRETFERAIANLQAAIVETGAVVNHDPLPTLTVDKVQFTQLFQNLIGNAIKFHNDKPPRIHVSSEQKNGEYILSVKDNGIGIDPEYADRIFMIFQRLHNRTEYKGTGIGLAICKKIIERHGGRIWVESAPGKGARFFFTVPVKGEQMS